MQATAKTPAARPRFEAIKAPIRSFLRGMGYVRADEQQPKLKAENIHDTIRERHVLDAARRDRLMDHWQPTGRGPNAIHHADAKLVRARARDLVENNPMARAAVDTYKANVVETGIIPRPQITTDFLDLVGRQRVSDAWASWCEKEADITGHQHFYEMLGLWLEEVIVGGGCMPREVTLSGRNMRNRRLPFTIDLLPEERFADDQDTRALRSTVPGQAPDTLLIRGVEVDQPTGRPLAYWLWKADQNDLVARPNQFARIRVPAEQVRYAFLRRRISMYRGLSMLTPAILWLHRLGFYLENELASSVIKSCWTYLWTSESTDDSTLSDDGTATDAFGNPLEKAEPGLFLRGRHGDDIKAVGPSAPLGDTKGWVELMERTIALAVDLSRSEMYRDTGKGSFSAIRAERAADRKRFRTMQAFTIRSVVSWAWERFWDSSVLMGRDGFPSPSKYAANRDEFLRATFSPPGFESINPREDAEADDIRLRNRTITRGQIVSREGGDVFEVFNHTADEEEYLEEIGLTPYVEESAQTAGVVSDTEDEADEEAEAEGGADED